jgi:hypothetical protein
MRPASLTALAVSFALLLCAAPVRAQQDAETPAFEFHSGFWLNLHHFLYREGRIRIAESRAGASQTPEPLAAASTDGMTPEQQRAWNAAVTAYAADWSSRDLLLNGDMVVANNRLAELENCPELSGKNRPECEAGLRPDLVAALNQAAAVYRARWWTDQDRENRAWIAAVAPLVRQMGADLAGQLSIIYQREWPRGPTRVDVVWSAEPLGAYTTLNPVHVVIASNDPRNQGPASFEVLFHEASHSLSEGVSQAIANACRERDKPIPRDLWHALLYYTTGEMTRRVYARTPSLAGATDSASDYTPYADRNGLYDKDWSQYRRLLETYWQPYLDGKISFDTAIARMVSAL